MSGADLTNSRNVEEFLVESFCVHLSDGLQTFQDQLLGSPRSTESSIRPTHWLNTLLLKTEGDFVDVLMEHARTEGLLTAEVEASRVQEAVYFPTTGFSEILSSIESCTAEIFPKDPTVPLGEVLEVMEISNYLRLLNPFLMHAIGISCSDCGYKNHCKGVTKKLYSGASFVQYVDEEPTERYQPTEHKPIYLIILSYSSRLPLFKKYILLFINELVAVFRTAIKAKFSADIQPNDTNAAIGTYDSNVEKLCTLIEALFDGYVKEAHEAALRFMTKDFNKEIEDIYSHLKPSCDPDMVKKYLKSGDEEDLHDNMLENHCQILRNLSAYLESQKEEDQKISTMVEPLIKILIASMFQPKIIATQTTQMIPDDVD